MADLTSGDLEVENGTGLVNANSYAGLVAAASYHNLRCNTEWADADESDQVAALIRGTDYLERRWCFLGTRFTDTQKLWFPIASLFYDARGVEVGETVPIQIEESLYEYALRAVIDGSRTSCSRTPSRTPAASSKRSSRRSALCSSRRNGTPGAA